MAAPANTGSSPSAWDGEWSTRIYPKEFLFLSSLSDPLNPPATSQPPELPEKPASVPSDETADPAERRPASRIAAGDRQGKPGAPAGEKQLSGQLRVVPWHSDPSSFRCHCASAGDPNQPGGFHSDAERTQSGGGAWRWGGGCWRDRGRHEQHQSHEIHPGHAAGERSHREGEDRTSLSVISSRAVTCSACLTCSSHSC